MRTDAGPKTARAVTLLAGFVVAVLRRVKIRGRSAKVGDGPAKRFRLREFTDFLENALRAATGQKLALMKTEPAKGPAPGAATRDDDRILDGGEAGHALLIGRMLQPHKRQFVKRVEVRS